MVPDEDVSPAQEAAARLDACNDLLRFIGITSAVNTAEQVVVICQSTSLLVAVLEKLVGTKLPDANRAPATAEDRIHNFDVLLKHLSEMLKMNLTHITGHQLAAGDIRHVSNLLELLSALVSCAASAALARRRRMAATKVAARTTKLPGAPMLQSHSELAPSRQRNRTAAGQKMQGYDSTVYQQSASRAHGGTDVHDRWNGGPPPSRRQQQQQQPSSSAAPRCSEATRAVEARPKTVGQSKLDQSMRRVPSAKPDTGGRAPMQHGVSAPTSITRPGKCCSARGCESEAALSKLMLGDSESSWDQQPATLGRHVETGRSVQDGVVGKLPAAHMGATSGLRPAAESSTTRGGACSHPNPAGSALATASGRAGCSISNRSRRSVVCVPGERRSEAAGSAAQQQGQPQFKARGQHKRHAGTLALSSPAAPGPLCGKLQDTLRDVLRGRPAVCKGSPDLEPLLQDLGVLVQSLDMANPNADELRLLSALLLTVEARHAAAAAAGIALDNGAANDTNRLRQRSSSAAGWAAPLKAVDGYGCDGDGRHQAEAPAGGARHVEAKARVHAARRREQLARADLNRELVLRQLGAARNRELRLASKHKRSEQLTL